MPNLVLTSEMEKYLSNEEIKQSKSSGNFITFERLKQISKDQNIPLKTLLKHSSIYYPPIKIIRSPEILKTIEREQVIFENRHYQRMVSNVRFKPPDIRPYTSFKGQISTGLDFIVTMFTFAVFFYFILQTFFSFEYRLVSAALGLIFGLLMESILFIIRAGAYNRVEEEEQQMIREMKEKSRLFEDVPKFSLTEASKKKIQELEASQKLKQRKNKQQQEQPSTLIVNEDTKGGK